MLKLSPEPTTEQRHCFHKWEVYTGLREQFEHCTVCGVKKKDIETDEPDDKYEPGSFGFYSLPFGLVNDR